MNLFFDYSVDIDFTSSNALAVPKNSIIRNSFIAADIEIVSQTPSWLLSIRGASVNGYHKDSFDGLQYFSFNNDVEIQDPFGSMTVLKNSILKCTDVACDNVSIYYTFDRDVQIDAFSIYITGDIYFSVDHAVVTHGLSIFPADIVVVNIMTDTYTVEVDSQQAINGQIIGINSNIDAISVFPFEPIFVSFKEAGCISGTSTLCYTNNDVISIGNLHIEPLFAPTYFGDYNNPTNISSLMVTIPSDVIFVDGFE